VGYLRLVSEERLRVAGEGEVWLLRGPGSERFGLVNEFLGYLADRNFSPRTRRAYAFDLLAFARWLDAEGVGLGGVDVDVLLRFLAACREARLPGRPGGNVYSIRDGRNAGYAPATINRRLAAISALFAFREMRDPDARNPVPRGRAARVRSGGERSGLLAHVGRPRPRSRLRVRESRRLPRGLSREESAALLGSLRSWRDRAIAGLMLLSGLRSAEVLGLRVSDVDIARRWVRVLGKGGRERSVPIDTDVAGAIQTYLLAERPDTQMPELFVVAKGPRRGQPLTAAGLRTVFRYHRARAGVPGGHPHALRHSFGTALAEAGVDLSVIQALMGHDHVDSSAAYIHLAPSFLREEFDAARARLRARS
jgi:site-specific recombinase XerD